ncbi:MAG: Protein-L-isoaspartate O-methyltransferase [Chloroflexi bacterium]|nr:Protein-L-isoaspartate O-methyltransferase [Chloroflexota bacterium]
MTQKKYLPRFVLFFTLVLILVTGCSTPTPTVTESPTEAETSEKSAPTPTSSAFDNARAHMVETQIKARGVTDPAVLAAMENVPRHEFVPDRYWDQAYADHPLPIGHGQTISQPYIVALMSETLGIQAGDRVLEVGTGSGYQAAVLAEMSVEIYTIEIIPELADQAEELLDDLSYQNVQVLNADGYFGWEEHAPFDAIIVTAAPDHLPQPLANQLQEGGRLVIPIGPVGAVQTLWLFEKVEGEMEATNLGAVRFVPLTGEH